MAYLLVVDDDEDFAAAVATVLRRAGHEVEVEDRLSSVPVRLAARRPDLIVLDVMFPEDNTGGFALARSLRHDPAAKDVPILMLTAINIRFPLGLKVSDKDIDDDWLPVTEFLEKPVDLDVLTQRVETILATRRTTG